tara:strand:- start:37602 stop:38204 length:603 start_codon:yes stop_codon:yes gene_type:complete
MSSSLDEITKIISKLPGLGPRSARRLIFFLIKNKDTLIPELSYHLSKIKNELMTCEECGNIDILNPCSICSNPDRDKKKICIVEDVSDLMAIEKSAAFYGKYFVLGGVLSAIDGVGPEDLNIKKLIKKVSAHNIEEIILATNSTIEGQITAQYIAEQFSNNEILITRLAQGMPQGGELDYIDETTLSTAIKSRNKFMTNP